MIIRDGMALGVNSIDSEVIITNQMAVHHSRAKGGRSSDPLVICAVCGSATIMHGICPVCSGMEEEVSHPWRTMG